MGYRQSTSTDQDAINAAALDVGIPTPNLDDAIEDAKKLTSSAESQQTKDTKFLNSSDVFTALGTGIMALMTGGASLGASIGVGAGAAVDSSITRRKTSAAQAEHNADQFRGEALQLHGAETNQYVAKMNTMGRASGGKVPMTGATGERLLEILKYGSPDEYAQGQASLVADGFSAAAYISQDMLLKADQNKFLTRNYSTINKQAQQLLQDGYPERARALLGPRYANAIPDPISLFDPDDPIFEFYMDYVVNNKNLNDGQRTMITDQLQMLKAFDRESYDRMDVHLQNIDTSYDQLMEEMAAKFDFLGSSYEGENPQLGLALRMISLSISGGVNDPLTNLLDFGGTAGANNQMWNTGVQGVMKFYGDMQNNPPSSGSTRRQRVRVDTTTKQPASGGSSAGDAQPTGDPVNDTSTQKSMIGSQALDETLATFDQYQLSQFTSLQGSVDSIVKESPILASSNPNLAMTAIFDQLHRDNPGLERIMEAQEFRAALEMYVRNLLSGTTGSAANGSE